ncbi:MAG TPA: glutathionylspermidine synthase family protein [Polyangia bacterium]|jgi:glutathionylspermidine synthase
MHIQELRGGAPAPIHVVRPAGRDPLRDPEALRQLATRFLVWDAFVGGRPRVAAAPLVLSARLHAAAVAVAERTVAVLDGRVARWAMADPAEAAHYGFAPDVEALVRASWRGRDTAALVRLDLLLDRGLRWRPCEINADCAGGHNETLALPRLARAAGARSGRDPTFVVDALTARLVALARGDAVGLTYATGHAEDLQICALVAGAVRARGHDAVLTAPTALKERGGFIEAHGRRLGALYRYFPTEYMEGQTNLEALAAAVAAGRLRTLTSFAHMPAQSKVVMARAWARLGALPRPEAAFVRAHVPYTIDVATTSPARLVAERPGWVLKRALGRVGDEVFVGDLSDDDDWAELVAAIAERRAGGERWIAQAYVPQRPLPTPWGARLVTLGAYVLDGRFVGYFARLSPESHVSHDALVVPVLVEDS